MALPKQYRLRRTKEFAQVYQAGRQSSTRHLVVKVLTLPEQFSQSCSRFGITISQKVSKQAVVRNRIKRRVRAALQVLIPRLRSGLWLVIVVRSPAVECDYGQFLRELEQLFLELEVLDGH
ncbi:MAG TPA: ribonuclease P protein component [Candidatus Obscuribacterales bacterium]